MAELHEKKCVACEGEVKPLTKAQAEKLLAKLTDWKLDETATQIYRIFSFKNYYQTIAFVNAIAWMANKENHHPDLEVHYNSCKVIYQTHAISGLSDNDFICASKVDRLMMG